MSAVAVPIKRIRVLEAHPNADSFEFAIIDGYRSLVKKGEYRPGDLVAYIPESALVPEWLLRLLGFWDTKKSCGKLTGKNGNCVKAIQLRGALSQGICYPVVRDTEDSGQLRTGLDPLAFATVREGDNVAGLLGFAQ